MEQNGSSYRVRNRVDNYRWSGLPQISCEVKTPDGILRTRTECSEDFNYNGSNGTLVIYAQLDNQQATFEYNTSTQRFTSVYEWGNSNGGGWGGTTYSDCNSYSNSCTLDLSTDDDTPLVNQSVDLTARFLYGSSSNTSYVGQVRFYVYKLNSSSTYVTANNYNDYSITNDRYTFSSSDGAYKNLYDYIYFRTDGTYKVRVEDDYGRYDEQTFYAGNSTCGSSCSNSNSATNFLLDISDATPDLNQSISTYVTARNGTTTAYSYYGTVNFVVESYNGGYRYTASSSDYSLSPSSIYMSSSDNGYRGTSSQLVMYRSGTYRLKVVDQNNSNVYGYKEFTVNGNSTTQWKRFDLTTNDDTPGYNNFASLDIVVRDSYNSRWTNYNSRVRFQVYRRMYTSDSWTDITSSSTDNNNYRIYNTTYTFSSSDNGGYYNSSFIKFYSDSYDYKVRVVDDYDSSMAGEIFFYLRNTNLWGNNGNNNSYGNAYRLVGAFDPLVPKLSSSADLTLYARDNANRTVSNYNRRVNIEVEKRTSPSTSSRKEADDSDCDLNRSSYTFSTSDNGYVKLRDVVECKKKGRYRLKITDDTNSSVYGYVYLTIYSTSSFSSSVKWYTSTQLKNIKSQYSNFMSSVNAREMNNPGLAYDTEWNSTRRDFYNKLYEIVTNKSGKDLAKYSEYQDAIAEFNDDFNRLVK